MLRPYIVEKSAKSVSRSNFQVNLFVLEQPTSHPMFERFVLQGFYLFQCFLVKIHSNLKFILR